MLLNVPLQFAVQVLRESRKDIRGQAIWQRSYSDHVAIQHMMSTPGSIGSRHVLTGLFKIITAFSQVLLVISQALSAFLILGQVLSMPTDERVIVKRACPLEFLELPDNLPGLIVIVRELLHCDVKIPYHLRLKSRVQLDLPETHLLVVPLDYLLENESQ